MNSRPAPAQPASGRPCHVVFPWDLHPELACLPARPGEGSVLLVESLAKRQALPWHRQKLVLVLSAQRHFADELRAAGHDVELRRAPSWAEGIAAHVRERGSSRVISLQPREWGIQRALERADLGAPLELRPDGGPGGHFLLGREEALAWARAQKGPLRQDLFYRWMRRRGGWLMDGARPLGGRWSFDRDNRQPLPDGLEVPPPIGFAPDAVTREVMRRVARWPGLWGELTGFAWPVTRAQAQELLRRFVAERLPLFGPYQDALRQGAPLLWHSGLAAALNLSLLHPREVIDAALAAHAAGTAPLASVEGFLRQVVGWREFIRLVYWLRMPGLRAANQLGAQRRLPDFYWDPARTDLACLRDAAANVHARGYAHHIQRLMVLGNFALLAEVEPLELSHWFWAGFVDAAEWVQLPNVHGMALFADDAYTTKPYAASGAYIDRMSDHCARCPRDVRARKGPRACPFNPLFWRFLERHRARFARHPRLGALYRTWDRWSTAEREAILASAEEFLAGLRPADHGWEFHDDAG